MSDVSKKPTRNPIKAKVLSVSTDNKTAKVQIPRIVADKFYGKRVRAHTVVLADCSAHQSIQQNSEVEIFPCRRISKNKTWKVIRGVV